MANTYSEDYRRKVVSNYQRLWQEQSLSIDTFARQVCIHQTTVRQWIKKYAPDFDKQRKGQQARFRHRNPSCDPEPVMVADPEPPEPEPSSRSQCQTVTVQTEWYQEPDHNQEDLIRKLREEIAFLKQQVSYWMHQEAIPV